MMNSQVNLIEIIFFIENIELPLAGMLEACALGLYLFKQEKNNSEIKE